MTGAIVLPGGAGAERPGEAGLAQLTAAMLDEGTTSRSAEQIALAAESMAATISASCGWGGAYVSFKCLKGDCAAAIELAADILKNPTFPESELKRLRGQSIAALRAERDQAEACAHRALLEALYPHDHPYRHPLSGTQDCVESFDPGNLAAYHARTLVAARPTVIVAGDVDPNALAADLELPAQPLERVWSRNQRSS